MNRPDVGLEFEKKSESDGKRVRGSAFSWHALGLRTLRQTVGG